MVDGTSQVHSTHLFPAATSLTAWSVAGSLLIHTKGSAAALLHKVTHTSPAIFCATLASCCRFHAAQAQASDATSKVAATSEHISALTNAQRERTARNDLILRTLGPLQQEMDKTGMLLLGLQDASQTSLPNKEKSH